MIKRRNTNTILRMFNLDKAINKTIIVLFILLSVLIMKTINSKPTKTIVSKIKDGIYYEFSFKEDGKKIQKYMAKLMNGSKDKFEEFTVEIFNNIKQ